MIEDRTLEDKRDNKSVTSGERRDEEKEAVERNRRADSSIESMPFARAPS